MTDLYELNMAVSHLRRGMTGAATFSLFARRPPVAAGLQDCLAFLERFSFTAADLDTAYKLTEYGGRPVMKPSEGKATLPRPKQVYRSPAGDLLALRAEPPPPGHRPLLIPVMRHGRHLGPAEPLGAKGSAAPPAWPPCQRRPASPAHPPPHRSPSARH